MREVNTIPSPVRVWPGPASVLALASESAFDAKTVGVIAAGTILGTYGTRALDALTRKPAPGRPVKHPIVGLPV